MWTVQRWILRSSPHSAIGQSSGKRSTGPISDPPHTSSPGAPSTTTNSGRLSPRASRSSRNWRQGRGRSGSAGRIAPVGRSEAEDGLSPPVRRENGPLDRFLIRLAPYGKQHLLPIAADPDGGQHRDVGCFPVEPDLHHRAVEGEPLSAIGPRTMASADDVLVGEAAGAPCVPVHLDLAPRAAHDVLAHRALEQRQQRPRSAGRSSTGRSPFPPHSAVCRCRRGRPR